MPHPLRALRLFLDVIGDPNAPPAAAASAYRAALDALVELEGLAAEAGRTRICITCGFSFSISEKLIEAYSKKVSKTGEPYKLPGRCSGCRRARRLAAAHR